MQGSTFTGTGSDVEDGPLTGASLTWASRLNGAIGTRVSFSTNRLAVGTHTITYQCSVPTATHCSFDATTSTGTGVIVSDTWVWGSGKLKSATTPKVTTTYYAPATYQVTLTVKDAAGNTSSVVKPVTVP